MAQKQTPEVTPITSTQTPNSSDRQSQLATILIGLLVIGSGLLIYNYFQVKSAPVAVQPTPTPTLQAERPQTPTPTPSPGSPVVATQDRPMVDGQYTVVAGDSLWLIAEKEYGDGFSWVKIDEANHLARDANGQPVLNTGQTLAIPLSAATTQPASSTVASTNQPAPQLDQTPQTAVQIYTIQRGDTLWSIAQHVYGSGDRWTAIFNDPHNQLGHLANGSVLIHAGNQLYIPS